MHSGQNPREWLEAISEEDLARWKAFDQLEPIGRSYEQSAMICMVVDWLMAMVAAGNGGKYVPRPFKAWMPGDWIEPIANETGNEFNWDAAEKVVGAFFPSAEHQ